MTTSQEFLATRSSILIVDDAPENIQILLHILAEHYQTKAALNGRRALEIARSVTPPDLILLDVMMPDIDGYQVCKELKADPRTSNIPVLFVTSQTDAQEEARGFALGAVDYLTKPLSPPVVLARLATHLALYDQNRSLEAKVLERTQELTDTRQEIVRRLGLAAEFRDNETGEHIVRMSKYCEQIALAAGFEEKQATLLLQAAPMHDVGKIGIPDRVLLKPGKLNQEEWEVMKTHTLIGAKIIGEHTHPLLALAREIAVTHHERWDGTGYPYGLSGADIPVTGRIAAIADVFDALTSVRPYKKAWSEEDAITEILRCKGSHFDPDLVDAFVQVLPDILHIRQVHTNAIIEVDEFAKILAWRTGEVNANT